jgi:hypothetical protein
MGGSTLFFRQFKALAKRDSNRAKIEKEDHGAIAQLPALAFSNLVTLCCSGKDSQDATVKALWHTRLFYESRDCFC